MITPEQHREQIEAYSKVVESYKVFADALRRILQTACQNAFPEVLVQTRAKTLSSFAEKAARKFYKYKNPVEELTDLCGGRVIVQTLRQVQAVCQFIDTNFEIVQKDDKGLLLGESAFGYRDMHYLVRLLPEGDKLLGVTEAERKAIYCLKNRTAEIQVRTWLQHAWADSTHDRLYKSSLSFSKEIIRTGNLLAAEMERGDRGFDELVNELDGMVTNYTRFVSKADVEKEIAVQELIFANEPDEAKKPGLALKLAHLCSSCGSDARVVQLLKPFANLHDANRCETLLLLGFSLCRAHASKPSSRPFRKGKDYLRECVALCTADAVHVQDLRKQEGQHARALMRLGWAWNQVPGQEHEARECFKKAHEHEPANPYYLAEMLGMELRCIGGRIETIDGLRPMLRIAIETCKEHAETGNEIPQAYFTAGRLSFLLEESDVEARRDGTGSRACKALGWYARGIAFALDGTYCIDPETLSNEAAWLQRVCHGKRSSAICQHILKLLELARHVADGSKPTSKRTAIAEPVLLIAGGADSFHPADVDAIRPLLNVGLQAFRGTVISGGTMAGVPGCVGDVAACLASEVKKQFHLLAYRPQQLPENIKAHEHYDDAIRCGDDFNPEQILSYWKDILASGINPRNVSLLGFGGGSLSAVEYQVALALGASVGLVPGIKDAAHTLLSERIWASLPNLYPLGNDAMTLRAFIAPAGVPFDPTTLDKMARQFHARYVSDNTKALPEKLKPWPELQETFRKANGDQAAYAVRILEAAGFAVRKVNAPTAFDGFTDEEIERMAEMEHGRWVVERLRDGWRPGPRDDAKKLHDCLVPWEKLSDGPDGVRKYDRDAVRVFPRILANAGLEVYRP